MRIDENILTLARGLALPEKSKSNHRLYDYLHFKRNINSKIIHTLIQEEMIYEDTRGNVVFVGYGEYSKPRFACLLGTHGDCSFHNEYLGDKRYGFGVTAAVPSERLYIFKSAIDLMSHGSIENFYELDDDEWLQHHRLSLSGTSDDALPFFLNQHDEVKEFVFCLDNDPAGREAANKMAGKYDEKGYLVQLEFPHNKDYSEDLQGFRISRRQYMP